LRNNPQFTIHNINLNTFDIFDVHDLINFIAKDSCHPVIHSNSTFIFIPLKNKFDENESFKEIESVVRLLIIIMVPLERERWWMK